MKLKIAVLFGGKSVEHEVSIISALQAVRNLNREKYEVFPVYITKGGEMYTGEYVGEIQSYQNIERLLGLSQRVIFSKDGGKKYLEKYPRKLFSNPKISEVDLAFPIVHGTNVEDGALHGYLQTMDIPFVGCDILSSAVGMDKFMMKSVLKSHGVPVLDCICFTSERYKKQSGELLAQVEGTYGYPVIVKPVNLGSSVGITIAADRESLERAVEHAFLFSCRVLVERAVQNLKEINCSVLGDLDEMLFSQCEEPMKTGDLLSYQDKYASRESAAKGMASSKRIIPAEISEEAEKRVQEICGAAFFALQCNGLVRMDLLIDQDTDEIYFNEVNTIPGSLSFYLWEGKGIKYSELLDRMIQVALRRMRQNANLNFSFETNILSGPNLSGTKFVK